MGCPDIWYKVYLEYFVQLLSNKKINDVKQMSKETLETYITEKRSQVDEKYFYYLAGVAAAKATNEAYETSCDDFNAAVGGCADFEDFIELYEV